MDNYSMGMPYKIDKFTARNDYAFKKLFGTDENKDIMSRFISLITGIDERDFEDVRIANNELSSQFYKDKTGRLDIKIILKDGKKINVEMQKETLIKARRAFNQRFLLTFSSCHKLYVMATYRKLIKYKITPINSHSN